MCYAAKLAILPFPCPISFVRERELKDRNKNTHSLSSCSQDTQLWNDGIAIDALFQVMKHDKIMESAVPDGSLVDSEAQHVAQDAIKKLKEARRLCYRCQAVDAQRNVIEST